MKISLNWLADFLPPSTPAEAAAEALTHAGLPVEAIEPQESDTVIDVEVTSNRGDCLSHVGIARELSALLDREVREPAFKASEVAVPAASLASVVIETPHLCPHYTARVIRNVKIGPSSDWMRQRLQAIGVRPINNVVDVTNYVLFELGQPLHAFDFDKLHGRRIVVRLARAGETLTSLDGHERKLAPDMLVIADADRPVALAGVMGGLDTEVSGATRNILLESARFDPLSVRKTARALAMRSDSSYRFERGIDPLLPERASLRAAQLILETAGGELLAGVVEAGETGYQPRRLPLRLSNLKRVLGIDLPPAQVVDALRRLRLAPVLHGDRVEVTVPSDRLDLNIEIDLVEEVARLVGYDKVPVREEIAIRVTAPEPSAAVIDDLRSTLVGAGYFEAVTFSFVSDLLASDFVPPDADPANPLPRVAPAVRKADASLRPSLLPGLLEAVRRNETNGSEGAKLFEIGSTFWNDRAGNVQERRRLGFSGSEDVREVRGVVEAILTRLDAARSLAIIPDNHPGFGKGAGGRIEWGGATIGYLGKIDQAVAEKLSLRVRPAAAQIDLEPLLAGAQLVPQLRPLPKFPAVRRDLSFVLPEPVRFAALESAVRSASPQWMEDLEYVTTYRGKPLEKGTKSVTITLVFRSPSETLTSEAVEASVATVVEAVKTEVGATLRT